MNIFIESTLNGSASGHLELRTTPNENVDSLISGYCIEKGIRYKNQYVLKNAQNVVLESSKSIGASGISSGDVLYLTTINEEQKLFGFNNWWILCGVSLFIAFVGLITISVLFAKNDNHPPSYGIVFDAGSTHTTMTLYLWNAPKSNGTGLVTQISSCKVEGDGISSYVKNPDKAGESLKKCLKLADDKIVNKLEKKDSLVFLGATAGMRLLNKTNPNATSAIMASISKTLSNSGFYFKPNQSRIISGQEEGLFGWITGNYLSDKLGNAHEPQTETYGALDLGGASTQISFAVDTNTSVIPVQLYGVEYKVFSQSFLCFGQKEMERRFLQQLFQSRLNKTSLEVDNPCGLKGDNQTFALSYLFNQVCTLPWKNESGFSLDTNVTFKGIGDSEKCNSSVQRILNLTLCMELNYAECFDASDVPPISGKFLAFSSYFYLMDYFNMTNVPSLKLFREKLDYFCNRTWPLVNILPHKTPLVYVEKYCLVGHYVMLVLTEKYLFNTEKSWENLRFVGDIKGVDVGWSLGFMTNATNAIPPEAPLETLSVVAFSILVVIFTIFLLAAVAIAFKACEHRRRVTSYQRLSQYGAI